jgi:hypothetical protein
MGHMGWWRPFGLEAELEMADDPVDGLRLGNSANVPVHESYLVVGIRSAGIFLERCLEVF